ncbi:MAG: hypothetical protein ACP6IS_10665 [Candidatus Asgardarchaeia archaeon]
MNAIVMMLGILEWVLLSVYSAFAYILIIFRVLAYISFILNLMLWLTGLSPYKAKRRTVYSLITIFIIEYLLAHPFV